jgi:hypothetical protein
MRPRRPTHSLSRRRAISRLPARACPATAQGPSRRRARVWHRARGQQTLEAASVRGPAASFTMSRLVRDRLTLQLCVCRTVLSEWGHRLQCHLAQRHGCWRHRVRRLMSRRMVGPGQPSVLPLRRVAEPAHRHLHAYVTAHARLAWSARDSPRCTWPRACGRGVLSGACIGRDRRLCIVAAHGRRRDAN